MTDVLIRDEPNDTGEIPAVDPGTTTRNLAPYAVLPPAMRRPDAVLDLIGDFRPTAPGPDPTPPFPPPPPPPTPGRRSVLYVMPQTRPFAYAGRHRPGWHGKLRRTMSAIVAPLVRAL